VPEESVAFRTPAQQMPDDVAGFLPGELRAEESFKGHPREVLIRHFIPPKKT
jgi:hypothetical protein